MPASLAADRRAVAYQMTAGLSERPWLFAALLTVGSILTQGYLVGIINHGLQIPLIRSWAGDQSFANDPFIQDLLHSYTSAFYPAVGWLTRLIPIGPLFFGLFVLFRFLSIALARRLSLALFGSQASAILTALLIAAQTMSFADDVVSDVYLTHGALAQVLCLAALAFLAEDRLKSAFAAGGLLFAIHGMHAVHLLPLLAGSALIGRLNRKEIVRVLLASTMAAIGILPTLWWMVRAGVLGAPVPEGYLDVVFSWFPAHFLPSTWALSDWVALIGPAALMFPVAKLAGPAKDGGRVGRIAVAALVLGAGAGFLTELHPTPFLVRLHPMRLSFVMALAGAPYLAEAARQLWIRKDAPRYWAPLGALLIAGLAVPMTSRWSYWLALAPALWAAARGFTGRRSLVLVLLVGLLLPLACAWDQQRTVGAFPGLARVLELGEFLAAGFGVVAGGLLLVAYGRAERGTYRGDEARQLLIALLVAGSLPVLLQIGARFRLSHNGRIAQWRQVQEWAGEHLPAGATVLVPLSQIGFRTFSKQTPAVDFQEGDLILHDMSYAPRFQAKLDAYGVQKEPIHGMSYLTRLERADAALTKDQLLSIGKQLGAKVAVRRAQHPQLDLPELYRNQYYVVLDLQR
ncbi:MAG: hypothetical protein U1E65_05295 [Myxococcota bacterium]